MSQVQKLLEQVRLPRMLRVRQRFDPGHISPEEIPARISRLLHTVPLSTGIHAGMRIALTAGSREIQNMDVILAAAVSSLRELGADPFIVPAMGSHGGASAEGQRALLSGYRITEESCGCPILSSMETVCAGRAPDGRPVFLDRTAAEADGILLINRIKAHTGFRGRYESGLLKMMVIGLGKQAGAESCHHGGFGHMAENLERFGRVILENAPILGGIAILENAFDQTARLVGLGRDELLTREPLLLELAKAMMPQILLPECDVLIVDEIGKNFSGTGMDPNVTGRHLTPYCSGGLRSQSLVVLRISPKSHRNGYGIGAADCITEALRRELDLEAMYVNGLTCNLLGPCAIPPVFENDRLAIQAGVSLCQGFGPEGPRVIRIANTLSLGEIMVSENYQKAIQNNPRLEILDGPLSLEFDSNGTLAPL